MNEQTILEMIQNRNEQGIEEFMRHYGPLMRYITAPILPNIQDQEECIADIVLRVWENIDTFDPKRGKWNTWLTALIRNTALNKSRSLKSYSATKSMEDAPQELLSREPSPEDACLQQECRLALQRAIAKLPQHEQILFYRKYYYLQPTAQIAAELGLTPRAVEGKLYRIKRKLRRLLGGEWNE